MLKKQQPSALQLNEIQYHDLNTFPFLKQHYFAFQLVEYQ